MGNGSEKGCEIMTEIEHLQRAGEEEETYCKKVVYFYFTQTCLYNL